MARASQTASCEDEKKPKRFSFFASLKREKVEDDMPFLSQPTPHSLIRQSGEQDAADIQLYDQLMAVMTNGMENDDSAADYSHSQSKKGMFRLKEERVDEAEELSRLVGASVKPAVRLENGGESSAFSEEKEFQKSSFIQSREHQLKREGDLALLGQGVPSNLDKPSIGKFSRSSSLESGTQATFSPRSRSPLRPAPPRSSSFEPSRFNSSAEILVSPRKRAGTNKGRIGSIGGAHVPIYIGKFRSNAEPSSRLDQTSQVSLAGSDVEQDMKWAGSSEADGLNRRASLLNAGKVEDDIIGLRPWRADAGRFDRSYSSGKAQFADAVDKTTNQSMNSLVEGFDSTEHHYDESDADVEDGII